MSSTPGTITECSGVTARQFQEEIYPAARPVIMRGFIRDWPCVSVAARSDGDLIGYLSGFDNGRPVEILEAPDSTMGHFFYTDDLTATNFTRRQCGFSEGLRHISTSTAQRANIQSVPADDIIPGFSAQNRISFLSDAIRPRIWIGNQVTVQTHFDLSQNIACVVAGRRRFTLFPPEQLSNLYMGPVERSLAGTPVSLVRPDNPDYERFPKFREAEAAALTGDLEPGDAIFIPYFWWHHVRSLGPFNVLVNYWWNEYDVLGSPMDSFLHALLTIRSLPASMKTGWKAMFDEFLFAGSDESVDHIPPALRGGLGALQPAERAQLWQVLARNVGARAGRNGP